MKKILISIPIAFLIILFGCNNIKSNDDKLIQGEYYNNNENVSIYDINNNIIGSFERYGQVKLIDDFIIYTKFPDVTSESSHNIDYYCYDIKNQNSIKLGSVENWSYNSYFGSISVDNHLFMLVSVGDVLDVTSRELILYDIDLEKQTMTKAVTFNGGFPYDAMTAINRKILITNLLPDGNSTIEEYDIDTQKLKTILNSEFDAEEYKGEVLLQISSDEKTIYILRLKYNSSKDASLFLDYYDCDMQFLDSLEITSICYDTEGSDILNEITQCVANFIVSGNTLYYENFSMTRFLGKIENNSIERLINTNPHFDSALNIAQNRSSLLFFKSFNDGTNPYSDSNDLFLFDCSTEKIKKSVFYAYDERYYIVAASQNDKNDVLLTMNYKDPNTAEELPTCMYYISLNDLDFVDYE